MARQIRLHRDPPPGCTTVTTSTSLLPAEREAMILLAQSRERTLSDEVRIAVRRHLGDNAEPTSAPMVSGGDEVAPPEVAERMDERRAALGLRPEDWRALEALGDNCGLSAEGAVREIVILYLGSHIDFCIKGMGALREGEWVAPEDLRYEVETVELSKRERPRPRKEPRR